MYTHHKWHLHGEQGTVTQDRAKICVTIENNPPALCDRMEQAEWPCSSTTVEEAEGKHSIVETASNYGIISSRRCTILLDDKSHV